MSKSLGPSAQGQGSISPAAEALAKADRARAFYTEHKSHARAAEARKLEALFLMDAVAEGDTASTTRMKAMTQAIREDTSLPASERAIVVGTYEFQTARERIHSVADMLREYEGVARHLMKEFPDQPQGYVSLLTQSMQREPAVARAMAKEVADSSGPAAVRAQARRLMTRFDLVGQSIAGPLAESIANDDKFWQQGKAGLVYFWATRSPDSISFGEMLASRKLDGVNVIGICLDADWAAAKVFAASHKLPGRLVFVPQGIDSELAERLGAVETPAIYLTDGSGVIRDVRGQENIEAKLAVLGL